MTGIESGSYRVAGVHLVQRSVSHLVHDDGSAVSMACVIHEMPRWQAVRLNRWNGLGYCHTCGLWVRKRLDTK